jgi:hypothetical protein
MGFAVDLGRLYMARGVEDGGERDGSAAGVDDERRGRYATTAYRLAITEANGVANKYTRRLGHRRDQRTLASEVPEPEFAMCWRTHWKRVRRRVPRRIGYGQARSRHRERRRAAHVLEDSTASARTECNSARTEAIAGISAPLCTACGIESTPAR